MKIIIETIPHQDQQYETVGDWRRDPDGTLRIRVSDMGNEKYALLVALHELVEVSLCEDRGITTEEVDDFDKRFEAARAGDGRMLVSIALNQSVEIDKEGEPGDDPRAPYRKEHFFATNIERQMALELGVDWAEYDAAVMSL